MATITPAEIEALKQKHGLKVIHIVKFNEKKELLNDDEEEYAEEKKELLNDDDDEYPEMDFAFKKLGFDVLAASAALGQDNPIKAIKIQMESCLIWGDKEVLFDKNDTTVFTTVMQEFVKISQARTANLKKN